MALMAYPQPNFVFPTAADQPVWNSWRGSIWGNGTTYQYTLKGSINLCGKYYEILRESPWNTFGYLRKDNQKVYFRTDTLCSSREYLMYDFGLQPGDTTYIGMPYLQMGGVDTVKAYVETLDTLWYNNQPFRRWYVFYEFFPQTNFTYLVGHYWVEGVGNLYHPFCNLLPEGFGPTNEASAMTICLSNSQNLLFFNEILFNVDSCQYETFIPLGNDRPSPYAIDFVVHQLDNGISVGMTLKKVEEGELLVYDLAGRIITRQATGRMGPGTHEYFLSLPQQGLYLISFRGKRGNFSRKVLHL